MTMTNNNNNTNAFGIVERAGALKDEGDLSIRLPYTNKVVTGSRDAVECEMEKIKCLLSENAKATEITYRTSYKAQARKYSRRYLELLAKTYTDAINEHDQDVFRHVNKLMKNSHRTSK